MGYSSTIPFSLSRTVVSGTWQSFITVSTGAHDYQIADCVTMDYHFPITHAYAEVVIPGRKNTNVADNYLTALNLGYLMLDDGVSTKNCGEYQHYSCWTQASDAVYGEFRIPLGTNIASYLKPNTTYDCWLKNATAVQDNLILFLPRVEITMYGVV